MRLFHWLLVAAFAIAWNKLLILLQYGAQVGIDFVAMFDLECEITLCGEGRIRFFVS